MFKKKRARSVLIATALTLAQLSSFSGTQAADKGIQLTLAGAEPTSYSHATGGGAWNSGIENVNIRKSLEGENFICGDVVSYLTKVAVPKTSDLDAYGAMSLDLNYSISMDTTGESGVALGETVAALVNTSDSASVQTGTVPSSVSIINSTQTGAMFSKSAQLLKTLRVTGVESGETIILRLDTKIYCNPGSMPSGNLQVKLNSAGISFKNGATAISPAESLNVGEQTISLKNVQALALPSVTISKTVTTATGTCPGQESITVEPKQQVKFCYAVTNASSDPNKIVAPLYNVSVIADDNGIYPDFIVPLASGLTDLDKDGQLDDLAVGATAYAEYVTAFDGNADSTIVNTAVVYGFSTSTGGVKYSASDTATVYVDAPAPDITINKLTNGSDGPTILVGAPITWTYEVKNTGDRALHDVYVTDNQGVTVNCPATDLAIGASMTCNATGTAIPGNYANIGTVYGTWDSTQVTATDASSYFGANPAIDIQKTPDSQLVIEGKKATFTITVTNTGNVPLTGVVVSDAKSSDCNKTIGDLAVAGQSTYTCESDAISADLLNVANVEGYYGTNKVEDNDSANVTIDYLPNIEVTKSADPTSVPETGGDVTFTFSVKNKAPENFILTSLADDKFGDLNGQGTCSTPQTIAAGVTYSCTLIKNLASDTLTDHINVLTATGHDPEGNPGSGSDDAKVTFNDVLPNIDLSKSASKKSVLESGEDVTFTFVVTNKTAETFYLNTLVDDKFGDLNGQGSCVTPQTIVGNGTYTCTVTKHLGDWTLNPHTNIAKATGQDNEGNAAQATATETVNFIDLLPTISVTKTAAPTIVRSTGGYVDYTFKISNTGPETVTVTSFVDNKIPLSTECQALVGAQIPIAGNVQCTTHVLMVISAGSSFTNTVSVVAKDNEDNPASGSASATIKSYWFGRTPGYWKNHPTVWNSSYLSTQYIQNVFTIPTALLSAGILDLDGNKSKDTLIAGLAYKGGTNLSGGAQILLRAAIAALENKAYYGDDYPAESSVSALIAHVNSVLATQNRDSYIALANTYDYWNNGVESPLP